jgi:putative ABC transport system permease protein
VSPVAGRLLREGEDAPSQNAHVVILSHRRWTERFGRDPGVVGRTLVLNGVGHEVIGVLPPGTPYLDSAELFRPLVKEANPQRASWEMEGVRRLEPGVTFEAARADLQRVTRILAERHPDENRGMSGTLVPVSEKVAGDNTRRTLWVLVGAVGALLLIACVNLTNLLLAKAAGRTREMALRAALGATRRRIVGLLVAESLLLSAAGHHQPAAGGSAVAGGESRWPPAALSSCSWVATAVVACILPARQAMRVDVATALRAE